MNYWLYLLFLGLISHLCADELKDRFCDVFEESNGDKFLDCFSDSNKRLSNQITVSFNSYTRTLYVESNALIEISRIAPDALEKLTKDKPINNLSFTKIRFGTISKQDFKGVSILSSVKIDNPLNLEADTFVDVMSRSKLFKLIIFCRSGHQKLNFKQLKMKHHMWRLETHLCQNRVECHSCKEESSNIIFKMLTTSSENAVQEQILTADRCDSNIRLCSIEHKITTPSQIKESVKKLTQPPVEIEKTASHKKTEPENGSNLIWIVLVLSCVNSIIIIAILVFLVLWWNKITRNSAAKKHTIILEDANNDDARYIKLAQMQ